MKCSQLMSSFLKPISPIPLGKQDTCESAAQQFGGMSTYEPEFLKMGKQK